ncbi:TRAP transporter substrate-binding protein DctP [Paracoccus sp. (in: a-proteobacteria)]|uniref:TRAP transporter substrate-binding protein n=1 Tax=Paracoccus sp. TaxID=267 RepID=UPI002AFED59A|nr:TRAP transporter substrate-binding protein DctP [Paracoccus sp. (in: a-proteobacteria)]
MKLTTFAAAMTLGMSAAILGGQAGAVTLTQAAINPDNQWTEVQGSQRFMECVKAATNGSIDFNYFHSGQLGNSADSLELLTNGLAQISFVNLSSVPERLPLANISLLPNMGGNVREMVDAFRVVLAGDGPIAQEIRNAGITPLYLNVFPPYQMMSRTKPLNEIGDFSGQKIRVAGSIQTFGMSSLNAVPVQIGFADIYLAMQQGTIDAFIFSSMPVKDYSLQEVTKAMSRNANFGTATGMVSISTATLEGLSEDEQKALLDCGKQVEDHLAEYADKTAAELYDDFAASGIEVFEYSPDTMAEMQKLLHGATEDLIARLTAQGLPAQAAYDEYVAALGK